MRIERLQKAFDIQINWRAFPLHPETPLEGRTLEDLFAGRPVDIPSMLARLRNVARDLDLPFGERTMTFNSRLAQELGKWADDQGRGGAFHHAVFRAYFQRGENIARPQVLLRICKAVGLDTTAAQTVMDQRTYGEAVDRDWQLSRKMGITAVPTFVLGSQRLVGAQPYGALKQMVMSAGIGGWEGTP